MDNRRRIIGQEMDNEKENSYSNKDNLIRYALLSLKWIIIRQNDDWTRIQQ